MSNKKEVVTTTSFSSDQQIQYLEEGIAFFASSAK